MRKVILAPPKKLPLRPSTQSIAVNEVIWQWCLYNKVPTAKTTTAKAAHSNITLLDNTPAEHEVDSLLHL